MKGNLAIFHREKDLPVLPEFYESKVSTFALYEAIIIYK